MSSFMVANCGLNLSKIRAASFGSRFHFSEDSTNNCSRRSKAQDYRTPPSSSSFSSGIRRKGSVEGTGDGRRLHLRSLEAHTSLAMVTGEPTIPCDNCNGKGWLVCDFCQGEKVNVQGKNSRIYRRCPSCRTAGVVICPRCKVFKCVSFPDEKDANLFSS